MRIQSPLFAMNALARTQAALNRSMQQLASGQRINSAMDDPAGLSIAAGLESQIRGVTAGIQNINESVGFLSTAEGAISTQMAITQRMRELAVSAATGTLGKTDRSYLNTEFQALLSEFNRLAQQTNFNGTNLLDGTFSTTNIQVGSTAQQVVPLNLGSTLSNTIFPTSGSISTKTVGTGTFAARSTLATGASAETGLVETDLNGDGKLDLVSVDRDQNTISIFLGNGNGSFQARKTATIGAGSSFVVAGDVNGDGKTDILTADTTDKTVSVLLGNGDGTFAARTTVSVPGAGLALNGMSLADMNGDSKLDLVLADTNNNKVYLFLGNGNGTFAAPSATLAIAGGPEPVITADVNGDGKMDILAPKINSNQVGVFLGNGNGTFQAESDIATDTGPRWVTVADVNGDGKKDLITANYFGNTVSVLLGNGDGTYQAQQTFATGVRPFSVAAVDFNGDGKIDLVTADETDDTLSVLIGNGNGTFKARVTYQTGGLNAPIVLAGDLNGDGVADLVDQDWFDSTLSTFMGNTTTQSVGNPPIPFDISTQTDASNVLSVLDSGLTNLNTQRSNIGAFQSRISTALNLNQLTLQNISSARSQIMDTDFAAATSELVKNQILEQAGVSVLSQINFDNQLMLKLFNF